MKNLSRHLLSLAFLISLKSFSMHQQIQPSSDEIIYQSILISGDGTKLDSALAVFYEEHVLFSTSYDAASGLVTIRCATNIPYRLLRNYLAKSQIMLTENYETIVSGSAHNH
jgi:hypothetical protein